MNEFLLCDRLAHAEFRRKVLRICRVRIVHSKS